VRRWGIARSAEMRRALDARLANARTSGGTASSAGSGVPRCRTGETLDGSSMVITSSAGCASGTASSTTVLGPRLAMRGMAALIALGVLGLLSFLRDRDDFPIHSQQKR